jgi:chloramphenicol 3-O-phosphotransferase
VSMVGVGRATGRCRHPGRPPELVASVRQETEPVIEDVFAHRRSLNDLLRALVGFVDPSFVGVTVPPAARRRTTSRSRMNFPR